jgi:hypothetical protein
VRLLVEIPQVKDGDVPRYTEAGSFPRWAIFRPATVEIKIGNALDPGCGQLVEYSIFRQLKELAELIVTRMQVNGRMYPKCARHVIGPAAIAITGTFETACGSACRPEETDVEQCKFAETAERHTAGSRVGRARHRDDRVVNNRSITPWDFAG